MTELIVLAGPTASGKSARAVALAQRWGAEIVNADSQQVYRHFEIGTAKPTAEQLRAVPHHLVSVVEPDDPFSAGRFQTMADAAIADITRRGRPAVVVGGTGLYLRVLLHGVVAVPPADPAVRARLTADADRTGLAALHQRLARVDPESAARVKPTDPVRIIRALEIQELTGKPASAFRAEHGFAAERYPYRLFVLDPPRQALYQAIADRTREIFKAGLIDEVKALCARGYRNAPPMRSVGYAQALAVVDGTMSPAEAEEKATQVTRQYAKRQLTWFRRERAARFIQPPYRELDDL